MSRLAVPLGVDDLSTFAKSLRTALSAHEGPPSHVELLNMLARAAGFANFQQLRADAETADRLKAKSEPGPRADLAQVEKAARYFDAEGRLASWPARYGHQTLCLWVFWSRLPRGEAFTEREISAQLKLWHSFGDHALIRRAMVDGRMLQRNVDGSQYFRIEQQPPAELAPLLEHLAGRAASIPARPVRSD